MRQLTDTLVWLGVILVLAAVVYVAPRFASLVSAVQASEYRGSGDGRVMVYQMDESSDSTR